MRLMRLCRSGLQHLWQTVWLDILCGIPFLGHDRDCLWMSMAFHVNARNLRAENTIPLKSDVIIMAKRDREGMNDIWDVER